MELSKINMKYMKFNKEFMLKDLYESGNTLFMNDDKQFEIYKLNNKERLEVSYSYTVLVNDVRTFSSGRLGSPDFWDIVLSSMVIKFKEWN